MGETGSYGGQTATTQMRTLYGYLTTLVGCPHRDWTACGNSWKTVMPSTYLTLGGRPAFYVIQGADDPVIPRSTLAGFTGALSRAGLAYRSKLVTGYGHTDAMIGPSTALWSDVVAYVRAKTAA